MGSSRGKMAGELVEFYTGLGLCPTALLVHCWEPPQEEYALTLYQKKSVPLALKAEVDPEASKS